MSYVFFIGVLRWDIKAIALSCIVFFLYGSMIWGILPTDHQVSFESHFFGATIGIICAVLLRNTDEKPPPKRYDWEEDEPEDTNNREIVTK